MSAVRDRPAVARVVVRAVAAMLATFAAGTVSAALTERCSWPPPGGPSFRPDSTQAEVAPLVGDLDGDGLPEIVFLSFSNGADDNGGEDGVLRILSGADCSEIAAVEDVGCVSCFGDATCRSLDTTGEAGIFCPACTPALVDVDRDGRMEIALVTETGEADGTGRRMVLLRHDGSFMACGEATVEFVGPVAAVAAADLEGDGTAELIARNVTWRASGEIAWQRRISGIGATMAADLDGDGMLEVTTGQTAYHADGATMWVNGLLSGGSPSIADLDLDCLPDMVVTSRNRETINVVDPLTGAIRASAPLPPGDCPPRPDGQGGPPTLGDVDGDCVPEIGVAGCRRYSLFRYEAGPPERLVLAWEAEIDDETSRFTGSAIFDLEGDGTAEVLYNDHETFRVFDGLTGAVEATFPNTTNTLLEMPVVADADGDGLAEILLAANRYSFCCDAGVRVLVDDAVAWAPVRPLFNQHSYHVTNILDDRTLPLQEERSWSRYNTFRVQGEPLRDDGGPVLHGVPPDETAACAAVPAPPSPTASGGCGEVPPVSFAEARTDGPCAGTYSLQRTWSCTDRCGRSASLTQVVSVEDAVPPVLADPPDVVAPCVAPPPPVLTPTDACNPAPSLAFTETVLPGPCPQEQVVLRTWTAEDGCGNLTIVGQRVDVVDEGPPALSGVPADVVVTCDAVPPPASPTASDTCDPAPSIVLTETETPGPCPSERTILRSWEARDACGRSTTLAQRIDVVDDGPPRLVGVPGDVTVDCGAVPPPAAVTAEDGCDPAPLITFREERIDGACTGTYRLVRTWTATDSCGRTATARQVVEVTDTTPPVIEVRPETACLWPPNHWMVCFEPGSFHPVITDDCSGEVTWRFAGCASDQPENDLGDGDFAPDCVLRADGSLCVRAERQGIDPEGRHYGIAIVATDGCGNASLPQVVADIYVPHDQSPHEDCLDPTKVGIKSGGNPRW
jgi:hypothetical protein